MAPQLRFSYTPLCDLRSGTTTPVPFSSVWTFRDFDASERARSQPSQQVHRLRGHAGQPGPGRHPEQPDLARLPRHGERGNDDMTQPLPGLVPEPDHVRRRSWSRLPQRLRVRPPPSTVTTTCRFEASCDDYGDAPDTYKTLLASDGPRHPASRATSVSVRPRSSTATAAEGRRRGDDATAPTTRTLSSDYHETAGQARLLRLRDQHNRRRGHAGRLGRPEQQRHLRGGRGPDHRRPAASGTATYPLIFPAHGLGEQLCPLPAVPGHGGRPTPDGSPQRPARSRTTGHLHPGPPILGSCANSFTFDGGNDGWRVATVTGADGKTVVLAPAPVGWAATAGNPGGGLISDDLDSNFTEVWTPPLVASGHATDYTSYVSKTISFDYKNNTGIGFNVYLGVVGTNGQVYWFSFRPQIINSKAWNRVRVPLDATKWLTGWSVTTGPLTTSPAPTQAEFLAALGSVERFTISIEGRNGTDRTQIDNSGQACDDFGDAPSSYGTDFGGEQPSHRPDAAGPALVWAPRSTSRTRQPPAPAPPVTTRRAPTTRTVSDRSRHHGCGTERPRDRHQRHRRPRHAGRLGRPRQVRDLRRQRAGGRHGGARDHRRHRDADLRRYRHDDAVDLRALPHLPRHRDEPVAHRARWRAARSRTTRSPPPGSLVGSRQELQRDGELQARRQRSPTR